MTIIKNYLDIVNLIFYKHIMVLTKHYNKDLSEYKKLIKEKVKLPLYCQVELILENFLENENIDSGNSFFSEAEVADQLGVSRPTVNKAFKNLIKKGILTKNRGKRSVVSKIKNIPLVFIEELASFGEMLQKQGVKHKTVLLERRKETPTLRIKKALNLNPGEKVIYLKRLRYVEEIPIIIVDSYLSYSKYSQLLDVPTKDFSKDLYKIIKNLFNVSIVKSDREVTATNMPLQDANLLNEEIWRPCIRLVAINYIENNEPCEFFDSRLKGQNCILRTSLKKEKN